MESEANRRKLQEQIGYDFRDEALLDEALTHSSFSNEKTGCRGRNNERLEFLGDAVLGLAAAHHLCDLLPDVREGELSLQRVRLVSEKSLAAAARQTSLGDCLLLGRGEELSGGREKQSILADAAEALVGAVFRDGGWEAACSVVGRIFLQALEGDVAAAVHDAKTRLQELCQEEHGTPPRYRLLSQEGPPHQPLFTVAVSLDGRLLAEGRGGSKKEAEQCAAGKALEELDLP